MHSMMLLNPFFDLSWAKDGSTLALHETSALSEFLEEEDDLSSGSGSSRGSNTSNTSIEDEVRGSSLSEKIKAGELQKLKAKDFSAKRHSKECLLQLKIKIDNFISDKDHMIRKNF